MQRVSTIISLAAALLVGGSNALLATGLAQEQEEVSLNGVWQTEGYGYLFDIKDKQVSLYETTSISCLPASFNIGSLAKGADGFEAQFPVQIEGFIDANMEIWPGESSGEKYFHRSDTNSFMKARKIAALPDSCSLSEDGPRHTAAVFRQTFLEHYPFFGVQNISKDDFAALPVNINDRIRDTALFTRLAGMVRPLRDAHVALIAPEINEFYFGNEEIGNQLSEADFRRLHSVIETRYMAEPPRVFAGGQIVYALLKDGLSYLKVDGFFGYSESDSHGENIAALNEALDSVMPRIIGTKGLVIDLRLNSGGSDELASLLASRFTGTRYVAYRKQSVIESGEAVAWSPPRETWVEPHGGPTFDGAVALLTGPLSVSAAETFTMAMMGRAPAPVRVGANTFGSFSDQLPRALPNGWLFSLPNERYLDAAGNSYDRVGIAPNITQPVFAKEDLVAGRDSALEAAINLLK